MKKRLFLCAAMLDCMLLSLDAANAAAQARERAAVELRGSLWQGWFAWLAASDKTESWLGLKP